ncbi:MAG TPA: glycosyltransferase family 1 protein [Pyrinomonadaceae bacterium]|nr:glycosyltransferase family 1 protein [Pyrinomonadaceae bacterium]
MSVQRVTRVAVVCDFREENWHSMNLVADMLVEGLRAGHAGSFEATRVCPPMRRRFTRDGASAGARFNADRLLNRFVWYPRHLRRERARFDLFHVVDHSYAHLVRHLPPGRAVVTCHDLDTFRCVLEPEAEPRPAPFRAMTRRVLEGFRKAARVACDSHATRDELLAHKLLPPARVVVIPNGVHPSFARKPFGDAVGEAERLLGRVCDDSVELLHVGSTAGRKRVDVLLETFACVRAEFPSARLVRVGGPLTREQGALAEALGVSGAIVTLPHLSAETLAAVYRRAALLLLPSEREGFGLPLVEALSCATPAVASDLPVLREVGGDAAVAYCRVADSRAFAGTVVRLLRERESDPRAWARRCEAGARRAAQFTWREYVERVVALYREVLDSRE